MISAAHLIPVGGHILLQEVVSVDFHSNVLPDLLLHHVGQAQGTGHIVVILLYLLQISVNLVSLLNINQ